MSDEHIAKLDYGPFFRAFEFRCKCGCGQEPPYSLEYQNFLSSLHILRRVLGFPFVINSGFRCENHPEEAGKAAPGAHFFPGAADISVQSGDVAATLVRAALERDWLGIGVNQKGPRAGRYIHLDRKKRPGVEGAVLWSY